MLMLKHRQSFSLTVLLLFFSPFLTNNAVAITYSGPFTNTTINAKGNVVIDLNIVANSALSGHINFTQSPGNSSLWCW